MRVLHVLASNLYSGAENVCCQIIKMFENSNVEMAYASPNGKIEQTLKEKGILFFGMDKLCKKQLRKIISEYNPDVIHAHDMRASYVVMQAKGSIPLISHIHNNAYKSRIISLKSIAYFFAARKADTIIWVSESARDGYIFHKRFFDKSEVLNNVIDANALYDKAELDKNEYSFDVIFLGRLSYPKNPERLMRVIKSVCNRKSDLRVAVVGTGELDEQVKQLAAVLKIDKNVEFLGFMDNPYKVLKCSKVMVMTSRWEGLPMCVLEAMCMGVPIVSTVTDGIKNVVIDGKNGYLSDDDERLSENIYKLVSNEKLLEKVSEETKLRFFEINDLSVYISKLKEIYSKACAKK